MAVVSTLKAVAFSANFFQPVRLSDSCCMPLFPAVRFLATGACSILITVRKGELVRELMGKEKAENNLPIPL